MRVKNKKEIYTIMDKCKSERCQQNKKKTTATNNNRKITAKNIYAHVKSKKQANERIQMK